MEKGVSHGVFHLWYYVICLISYLITISFFLNCLFICLLQVFVAGRGFLFSGSSGLVTPRYVES